MTLLFTFRSLHLHFCNSNFVIEILIENKTKAEKYIFKNIADIIKG